MNNFNYRGITISVVSNSYGIWLGDTLYRVYKRRQDALRTIDKWYTDLEV